MKIDQVGVGSFRRNYWTRLVYTMRRIYGQEISEIQRRGKDDYDITMRLQETNA
jgi:hypothetical protein